LNPNNYNTYYLRARSLRADGKPDEAIKDIETVIRLKPDEEDAFFMRGEYYEGKGRGDYYDWGGKNKNLPESKRMKWKGDYYNEGCNTQKAIDDYKKAARLGHKMAQQTLKK